MTSVITMTMNPTVDIAAVAKEVGPTFKVRHDPGGGGINVARVTLRLDVDVAAALLTPAPSRVGATMSCGCTPIPNGRNFRPDRRSEMAGQCRRRGSRAGVTRPRYRHIDRARIRRNYA